MRPPCYNRPPREPYYLANSAITEAGTQRRQWIPVVFVDRCATWDGRGIGPRGEPYPQANGWNCVGCKWLPAAAKLLADTSTQPEAAQ